MNESIRTVIHGQTLFKEAIVAFHPEKGAEYYSKNPISLANIHKQQESQVSGSLYGYILLDFELPSDWELPGGVIIERSLVINHGVDDGIGQECAQSFISPVLLPEWVNAYNGHLFLQGLAAVVSFTTARTVYAPGSSFGSVEEEKLVPLEKFIADNSGDRFANIKNAKVVIKTSAGDIWGRFWGYRPIHEEMQPVFPPHLSVQMETDNQFLVIKLDNDLNFNDIQRTPIYDPDTDEILVVQRSSFRQLATLHPIVVRGFGGSKWCVHKDVLDIWNKQISIDISNLWKLPYKKGKEKFDYKKCMQAIRMIQLAHNNYEEDFDLSFSMLVAAIESIAQKAMPKPGKHELHTKWKASTKGDPELKELFRYYCKLQGHDNRLKERFADFVFQYFPTEKWWDLYDDDVLRNGFNSSWKSSTEHIRRHSEFTPYHFTPEQLKDIVKDTYNYRSNFIHRGESTPHQQPASWQRFFEEQYNHGESEKLQAKLQEEDRGLCEDKSVYPHTWTFGEGEKRKAHSVTGLEMFTTKRYLINRDLMREITIKSISNYLAEQSKV